MLFPPLNPLHPCLRLHTFLSGILLFGCNSSLLWQARRPDTTKLQTSLSLSHTVWSLPLLWSMFKFMTSNRDMTSRPFPRLHEGLNCREGNVPVVIFISFAGTVLPYLHISDTNIWSVKLCRLISKSVYCTHDINMLFDSSTRSQTGYL